MGIVISVFLLVSGCLVFSSSETPLLRDETPLWETVLAAYGVISFQYDIHPSILTIQVDMREKSKLSWALLSGFGGTNY